MSESGLGSALKPQGGVDVPEDLESRRGKSMRKPLEAAIGAYVVLMAVALFYLLIKVWPLRIDGAAEQTEFFWGVVTIPAEIRLMLIAAVAGALGAYVHLATSFADYAGNQQLATSWTWWYLLRPFIGMALAEIIYLTIRGGLLSAGGGSAAGVISPYGVAAVTALTGLFSKQATDKLREVFETLFRTAEKVERKDSLAITVTEPAGGADLKKRAAGAGGSA